MRASTTLARVATLAAAATLLFGACIRVDRVEPRSPNIYGTFRDDSGAALVGALVAIDAESNDKPCGRTTYHDVTDSAGVFRLQATTRVQKWLVLIPPIERFGNAYGICASPGGSAAPIHVAFTGRVPLAWRGEAPLDTLACMRFAAGGATHVVCEHPRDGTIQTGGHWSANGAAGSYRLIADAARAPNGVFLQWLDDAGRPVRTAALPFPPGKRPLISDASLGADSAGNVCVHVRATNETAHPFAWSAPKVDASFALGAPGVMRAVRKCARAPRAPLTGL